MRVVALIVHGLTPAALGCYGNERLPTPFLDQFSRQAVVFDRHFADVPSVPGARSALSLGRHRFPSLNGQVADPAAADLREQLHSAGLRTLLVSDNPKGIEVGWNDVREDVETALEAISVDRGFLLLEESLLPPWDIPEDVLSEAFANENVQSATLEPWLDPPAGFLWAADNEDYERLQRTFAAAVRDWDQRFGMLLDMLTDQSWFEESLFIVASGRGQALGEHGICGDYRPWLHQELIHVPLLIRLPRGDQAGRRVCHLTQTIDLPATIVDAFGLERPAEWHGQSLLPLCRGGPAVRDYACFGLQLGEAVEFALRTPELSVILPHRVPAGDPAREPMYFVKPDDRWEVNNLRQPNLDRAEALERTLRAYVSASAQPGPLTIPPLPQPEE